MTESLAFAMHGARAAMQDGLQHIEEQVQGIEEAIDENPGLAFDLAKTLIESACRTILSDRGVTFDQGDDLPKLFKSVSRNVSFLPTKTSDDGEIRKSLAQTLNGLSTAVQGVCELRNDCGFASHGSDCPRPPMERVQALLAAQTADTIVGFLYRIHSQDRTPLGNTRARYESNAAFNDYLDQMHETICILDAAFRPSEVLFQMEPETYRIFLAEFQPETDADVTGIVGDEVRA